MATIGDNVLLPHPQDFDLHAESVVGYVIDIHDGFALVETINGRLEIEAERLEVVSDAEVDLIDNLVLDYLT